MKKILYFSTAEELIEYGHKNNIEYIDNGIANARKENGLQFIPSHSQKN